MANTRGMSTTATQSSADLVVDMADKVLLLEPDKNRLIQFVSTLRKKPAHNFRFDWLTDGMVTFTDTLGGAIADGTTTSVTVSNGDRWLPNDLLFIPSTGEIVRITAVSSNTLTVVRGEGGTAAAASNGAQIVKISSSWGEGSSLRDSSNNIISLETTKGNEYNYLQVEKTALSVTNSTVAYGQNGGLYSGDPLKHQAMLKGMEHAKKMEYTCFYGKRGLTASTTNRKTGGFIEFITTTSTGTSLTDAMVNSDCETFFRYGKDVKTLFCAKKVSRKIGGASALAAQRITPGESKYGVRIRHYLADTGEFDIVPVDTLGDITAYVGYGLFIDDTDIAYRFAPGRDTTLLVNAQLPDVDGKVSCYLTEWGLQRGHASHHAMWTAVS